jgi:hypothetical protein
MVGYIDILCWTVVCVVGIKLMFIMVDILLMPLDTPVLDKARKDMLKRRKKK